MPTRPRPRGHRPLDVTLTNRWRVLFGGQRKVGASLFGRASHRWWYGRSSIASPCGTPPTGPSAARVRRSARRRLAGLHLQPGGNVFSVSKTPSMTLAETAERAEEIDAQRAEFSRQRAEERLARRYKEEVDVARAQAALSRALNRLKVGG